MTYSTLMVHLELGRPNTGLLKVAAELAERFKTGVIGIAGRAPLQMLYAEGYTAGDLYQQDRDAIARDLLAAEAQFRKALRAHADFVQWRSLQNVTDMAESIATEARSADLVLTAVASGDHFDASRALNTGELVIRAGRPVLIVPAIADTLRLGHALVAWKDTREARRAVTDALPLLKHAHHVTVVELAREDDLPAATTRVRDVAEWLGRHGIAAAGVAHLSIGDDAAALYALGQDNGADLVVAGAYGHSRLREWVLGGVTRDLLLSANRFSLVSH